MENVIPMSQSNQILLVVSILTATLCLIIQEWTSLSPLPTYFSISWAVLCVSASIWLSCILLRLTLKANKPIDIEIINKLICKRLENTLQLDLSKNNNKIDRNIDTNKQPNKKNEDLEDENREKSQIHEILTEYEQKILNVNHASDEILSKCVNIWYKNISNDKEFPNGAEELLKKFLTRLFHKIRLIDKVRLADKLIDVFLLHLKEYRRSLWRVEKGFASSIEEAYKSLHPGSRGNLALEHTLRRLITILAQEFLQWELVSSLPCKLLLSILAKRLLVGMETFSCPNWIFKNLLILLQSVPKDTRDQHKLNGIVPTALSDGMTSVTAPVIPRPLPKPLPDAISQVKTDLREDNVVTVSSEKPVLYLQGLHTEHRGLWNDVGTSEMDSEMDDEGISPIYEEPTDFATTIARLRNLLQQKSTATTPLHAEEKSYTICEGNQFTNLSIPWTEFYTATDGSQQLLYCIQFDDVEQREVDLFETTTATVRRQYSDFVQLHASLEENPSYNNIMSELVLPKGGRMEMENYLKALCTRLSSECPPQLRHFLRPNSGGGKKADAVAPRFDRFLAKTVSGVFNTLKTVVPGFEIEQEEEMAPLPTLMPLADIPWRFVEDVKTRNLACELQHLIAGRIDCYSVDTAYEADETTEGNGDSELLSQWWEVVNSHYGVHFAEEVDDLDSNLTLTCAVVDLICELLTGIGSNNTFQQEAVIRWTKLFVGNITEPIIRELLLSFSDYLMNTSLIHGAQNDVSAESVSSIKDEALKLLESKVPYNAKLIFGDDDIKKILRYLLDSFEVRKMNLDLNLQIIEVLTSQLLITCRTNRDRSLT